MPLLSELPLVPLDQQPLLFACENDHSAVARLKTSLEGRVHVVDCMVDRVCTGRQISEEGVDVQAEPWRGSIVVLEPNLQTRVPFCSSIATVPSSRSEAEYLSERKFSLVNGMHTVLAFMTLCEQYVTPAEGEQCEYILLKYDEMIRGDQRICEAWRAARVAELVEKYGTASFMEWHGCETATDAWDVLLDFADYTLSERFSQIDDVVSRVLGGGVANRWLGRLRPVEQYISERRQAGLAGSGETGQLLLHALKRDRARAQERGAWPAVEDEIGSVEDAEAWVSDCLTELTMESRVFCARELEITHKQLIKQQRQAGGKKNSPLVQKAMDRVATRKQQRL